MGETTISIDSIPINRHLYLFGDLTVIKCRKLVPRLLRLALDGKPIVLWISSNGGDDSFGFVLYDIISSLSVPVITVATGNVMSSAVTVYLAGTKRFATPNCLFMIHPSKFSEDGSYTQLFHSMKFYKKVEEKWLEIVKSTTLISSDLLSEIFNSSRDFYFDVTQAIKFGVVNVVLTGLYSNISGKS